MKSVLRLSILALILGIFLVACGGGQPAYPPEMVAEGQQLFESTCAACHGPDAKGLEGLGKDMTTSEFIASLNDEELIAFVKQGRPPGDPLNTTGVDMPPKGGNPALTDENLNAIIAFIRSVQE